MPIREGREAISRTLNATRMMARELREELFGDTVFLEFIISSLALLSIITVIGDLVFPAGSRQVETIYKVDAAICGILWLEYIYRFLASRDRRGFIRHYWYEPISFLPVQLSALAGLGGPAVLLRLLRLVRAYRVITILGRDEVYLNLILDIIREARLFQLVTIFLLGVFSISLLAFMAEARNPHSPIQTLTDAFWWSLSTVTTVGYGDVYPVTGAGKALGVVLMVFGIATLGGFISLVSSAVINVFTRYYEHLRRGTAGALVNVKNRLDYIYLMSREDLEDLLREIRETWEKAREQAGGEVST